ncbi:RNA polymerase sigma factor [Halosquirtibacter laminarini]|uniref:RNA polymerase sigma factor n=1 Tax=Halosquirtibacter laminarini TaxID=3374600 RepID=A0AC61NH34_9BACT|nr:RNA polymerase sigma factor [Prolixibacteraceae bacterium]
MAKDDIIKNQLKIPSQKKYAFQSMVQLYHPRLYHFARKMVLIHEDTDDVLQESFLKAWKAIDKFRGEASLYTWLCRIVMNESLSFIEKKKKEASLMNQDTIDWKMSQLKSDPYFSGGEIELQLQKVILSLPEKQQLVFNMRYYEEMKYEEISEILDVSVGALKASYFHAKQKVEKHMLKTL